MRQFIEFAVNMPEQDPQVGQALASMRASSASDTESSAEAVIGWMRSSRELVVPSSLVIGLPDSMPPPETKTVGMFSRRAASSMPGVILSQLEMHTSASAWWALHMYSTESAMISRLGSE